MEMINIPIGYVAIPISAYDELVSTTHQLNTELDIIKNYVKNTKYINESVLANLLNVDRTEAV